MRRPSGASLREGLIGQEQGLFWRLPQYQGQIEVVDVTIEDWFLKVAAHIHVSAVGIRAGGVGASCRSPPVAGGDLLRRLVVEVGISAVADDAAACYVGRSSFVPSVVHTAAVGDSRVVQDATAGHSRNVGLDVDTAAIAAGCVSRTGATDGAAVLYCQAGSAVDAAAVSGCVVIDGAVIHGRSAAGVVDTAAVVFGGVARAGPANGAAILDDQRFPVVDAAAVVGGGVGADDAAILDDQRVPVVDAATVFDGRLVGSDNAAIYGRRTSKIVDAAAGIFGRIACAKSADGAAVKDVQLSIVGDTAS